MRNVLECLEVKEIDSIMQQEVCLYMAQVHRLNWVEMSLRPSEEKLCPTPVDAGHPLPPFRTTRLLPRSAIVDVASSQASKIFHKRCRRGRRW